MNLTPIQWTTFSANPLKYRAPDGRVVWACEKVSPGCKHCYAEKLSHRYGGSRRAGEWNAATMATLTPFLDEVELHKMRTAKSIGGKPVSGSRCFLGDMTDIFGEWVSDDLLNRLFSQTLELRTDVTWQLLTKRAERMNRYLSWRWGGGRIPSRHIHIGVSVEDQPRADERIPLLLQAPAAVRFISAEPLLEGLRIVPHLGYGVDVVTRQQNTLKPLDWVIVGGESGRDARPFDLAWARSIVQQCKAAGVPVFVKQLGRHPRTSEFDGPVTENGFPLTERPATTKGGGLLLRDSHGGDPDEWPADLRVRQFPEVCRG